MSIPLVEILDRLDDIDVSFAADEYESKRQDRELPGTIERVKDEIRKIRQPPVPMAVLMVVGFILTVLAFVEAII